jgi:hypothetical protein
MSDYRIISPHDSGFIECANAYHDSFSYYDRECERQSEYIFKCGIGGIGKPCPKLRGKTCKQFKQRDFDAEAQEDTKWRQFWDL